MSDKKPASALLGEPFHVFLRLGELQPGVDVQQVRLPDGLAGQTESHQGVLPAGERHRHRQVLGVVLIQEHPDLADSATAYALHMLLVAFHELFQACIGGYRHIGYLVQVADLDRLLG